MLNPQVLEARKLRKNGEFDMAKEKLLQFLDNGHCDPIDIGYGHLEIGLTLRDSTGGCQSNGAKTSLIKAAKSLSIAVSRFQLFGELNACADGLRFLAGVNLRLGLIEEQDQHLAIARDYALEALDLNCRLNRNGATALTLRVLDRIDRCEG